MPKLNLELFLAFAFLLLNISLLTAKEISIDNEEELFYVNPLYSGEEGILYGMTFMEEYGGDFIYFCELNYFTGNYTVLLSIPSPHAGGVVYYNSAIDVENKIFYYSNTHSPSTKSIIAIDMEGLTYEYLEGPTFNENLILSSNYPANGTIYLIDPHPNSFIYSYNSLDQTSSPLSSTPGNVYEEDVFTFLVPSFNNKTNNLSFTGYNSDIELPTLYFLDVITGNLASTPCHSFNSRYSSLFYEPILDFYFTIRSEYKFDNETGGAIPMGIFIDLVNISNCGITEYFPVETTRFITGWFQLFTYDQYSGYLFMNVFYYGVRGESILVIDIRNKQVVSDVSIQNIIYQTLSPLQFLPSTYY